MQQVELVPTLHTSCLFCGKPNNKHLNAAKRMFRYLKGTQDLSLSYTRLGNKDLIGYSDSDYAGDREETRRSTYKICNKTCV